MTPNAKLFQTIQR